MSLQSIWLGTAVHLWQSALFIGLLALAALALRHSSARLLNALYWTGVLKLALPLPLLGPQAGAVLDPLNRVLQPAAADPWGTVTVLMYPLQLETASGPGALPAGFWVGLTLVWAAGLSMILLRRPTRSAGPALDPIDHALVPLLRAAGLESAQVRLGPASLGPHVRGGLRPLVVLPRRLTELLEPDELRAVLIHEREHLERRDPLRYALLALLRALFWFYPPVWWLVRRILETSEMACDEAVVRSGLSPATYCRSLARTLTLDAARSASYPIGMLGHRVSFLRRRLERIRSARRFEAMFKHRLTVVFAALAALVLSMLPLTPTPDLQAFEGRIAGEGLDGLAAADTPVMLEFKQASLGNVFEALGKTSGVEFRLDESLSDRRITISIDRKPLEMVLQHISMTAGVAYELVDERTVAVSPVLLAGVEGVSLPVLIPESKVAPVYPEAARADKIEGRVMLQARIDREGNVGEVQVLSVQPDGFEPFAESATEAVGHWRYRPATRDGEPVDVWFTIRVEFALR
jgi:TonB family protein